MKLILVKHTYLYICPVVVGIMIKKQDQVSDVITFNFNIEINVFIHSYYTLFCKQQTESIQACLHFNKF